MHQFLLLRKFLDEIFLDRLLLLHFSARFSSFCTRSCFLFQLVFAVLLVALEAMPFEQAVPSVANTMALNAVRPNQIVEIL